MASYYDIWHQNLWLDTFWPEAFWYSDDAEYSGSLTVTLGGDTPSIVGSFAEANATTGVIAAALGPLIGSINASQATQILFDIPVKISVRPWRVISYGIGSGTIASTLGDDTSSIRGVAWDLSYTSGVVGFPDRFWAPLFWSGFWDDDFWVLDPSLEGVTAAISGTLETPGYHVGVISASLGGDASLALGSIYPPTNYRGEIRVTLGDDIAVAVGAITDPIQTGSVAATFDGVTGYAFGLFVPAGSFVGKLSPSLDGIASIAYGTFFIPDRSGAIAAPLEGTTGALTGILLPAGSKYGPIAGYLTGVYSVAVGTVIAPRMREKAAQPTVTEIDWKTLCDQHNLGLPEDMDYEFSSGRRFYQA